MSTPTKLEETCINQKPVMWPTWQEAAAHLEYTDYVKRQLVADGLNLAMGAAYTGGITFMAMPDQTKMGETLSYTEPEMVELALNYSNKRPEFVMYDNPNIIKCAEASAISARRSTVPTGELPHNILNRQLGTCTMGSTLLMPLETSENFNRRWVLCNLTPPVLAPARGPLKSFVPARHIWVAPEIGLYLSINAECLPPDVIVYYPLVYTLKTNTTTGKPAYYTTRFGVVMPQFIRHTEWHEACNVSGALTFAGSRDVADEMPEVVFDARAWDVRKFARDLYTKNYAEASLDDCSITWAGDDPAFTHPEHIDQHLKMVEAHKAAETKKRTEAIARDAADKAAKRREKKRKANEDDDNDDDDKE